MSGDLDGSIYVIGCAEPMAVKIGFTTKDPRTRLKQLQTGSPQKLVLIGWYPGNQKEEREIHADLAEFRMVGEWFQVDAVAHDAFRGPFICLRINNILTGYDPEAV